MGTNFLPFCLDLVYLLALCWSRVCLPACLHIPRHANKSAVNILHSSSFQCPSNQRYSKIIVNGDNLQHLNSIQSIIHLSYNTKQAKQFNSKKEKT